MILFFAGIAPSSVQAISASDFLDSIGTQSAISTRGENLERTIQCCKYLGVRWLRAGTEGNVPTDQFLALHRQTGIRFSWGLGSGGTDLTKLIATAKPLAEGGALLAFEGPNEPNNFGITYGGQSNRQDNTWVPVAKLQRDLYRAVKGDPALNRYSVWSISENGAETDNVGLQFLTIPAGAETSMPDGARYADYANVHNYIYHPNSPNVEDNKTWNAADPTSACKVDGLFGEYGVTWARHFKGYSEADLLHLPRVTTETGCTIEGPVTEQIHALNLLSLYLDQFKRGWSYSCVYLLRDRVDEGGNQKFGFYRPDYTPRLAATYLHNLTTILADSRALAKPEKLDYSIPNEPPTVHDLLLQKSNRNFYLVVWGEKVTGVDSVTVNWNRRWSRVNIYDPTIGVSPNRTLKGDNLNASIDLTDHPLVIELCQK